MSPVCLAQTVQVVDDQADVIGRYATASQLAAAIDLDCRQAGRLVPERFHRWIAILVGASQQEAAEAARELDVRLLAVGLRPFIRCFDDLAQRLRIDRYAARDVSIGSADLDSDDEEIMAFLHLLEAEAPQALSAVAELLTEEDAEELFNEDYAGYEERMASIGLKDYGRAAEVLARGPTEDHDPDTTARGVATTAEAFLARVLAEVIAHRDCTEVIIDRLAAQLRELSNDIAMAEGAGSDERAAQAARATAERLVAAGVLRRSQGDFERAVGILLCTSLCDLLREGLG